MEEQGRRKAEEAAKKLSPKAPAARDEEEDSSARRRPISGGPRPSSMRPISAAAKVVKPAAVPTRTKADIAKKEMRGRLTVSNAMDEDETSRGRSVAAFRRRTERLKNKSHGFQMPTEKMTREIIIPEAITIQEAGPDAHHQRRDRCRHGPDHR